jgi:ubiquinol-cytochrome c reductase cytochrome b subunit
MKKYIKIIWNWIDDRTGATAVWKATAGHPVPPKLGWMYVFGSATLVSLIVQVITGSVLATKYIPSVSQAYETLLYLTNVDPVGRILRGMHYWGASAMILFVVLHMVRVFLTGSYKFPREMNWITGVLLLGLTLGLGFSGQVLRWDSNAVWSVIVASEQAARLPIVGQQVADMIIGGGHLTGSTLSRFFVLHVFILPGILFLFLGVHLYLVIRNGISEAPVRGEAVDPKTYRKWYRDFLSECGEPFWPNAAWRDAVVGTGVIVAITLLALWFGPPPLDPNPDPTNLNADPRPDWYFLWYFAILALSPHRLENWIMVFAPVLLGIALLVLPLLFNKAERHPLRRPWAVVAVVLACLAIGIFSMKGSRSDWSPRFDTPLLSPTVVGTDQGALWEGAVLFRDRGCQYCHAIEGVGGKRGPDLSWIGDRLTRNEMVIRINTGGYNMPAYAPSLSSRDLDLIVDFLMSRKRYQGATERSTTPSFIPYTAE